MTRADQCETCGGPASDEELAAVYEHADENEHAAQLWGRLVAEWETTGGSAGIAALVEEWRARTTMPGAAAAAGKCR